MSRRKWMPRTLEDAGDVPEDIRLALSGNLCRCTGYTKVFDAIRDAAQVLREEESAP